jgi:hypothetical protein
MNSVSKFRIKLSVLSFLFKNCYIYFFANSPIDIFWSIDSESEWVEESRRKVCKFYVNIFNSTIIKHWLIIKKSNLILRVFEFESMTWWKYFLTWFCFDLPTFHSFTSMLLIHIIHYLNRIISILKDINEKNG